LDDGEAVELRATRIAAAAAAYATPMGVTSRRVRAQMYAAVSDFALCLPYAPSFSTVAASASDGLTPAAQAAEVTAAAVMLCARAHAVTRRHGDLVSADAALPAHLPYITTV
jgi:hypothetical protein